MSQFGGAPKCKRCGKSVYFAEEVIALGKKWHKRCHTCAKCNKSLDSTNRTEHNEELYCRPCHSREFGPKGYGFGGGAGILSSNKGENGGITNTVKTWNPTGTKSSEPSKYGGGEKCGYCGKTVYSAESLIGGGKVYHKSCFKCNSCSKKLDSSNVRDHERQLFCQSCYGKHFGPKGYGYGAGAGTLTNTQ